MAEPRGADIRRDVEGVRALAVIAVVLYHLDLFPGGYAGVDVFLVISGFVVTRSILFRIRRGDSFTLREFLRRRFVRLFPALLVVTAASVVTALLLFPSIQTWRHSWLTGLAALGFAGNIGVLLTSGSYFDPDSRSNVFLHTWSLGVEAQFYLAFGLIVFVVIKTLGGSPEGKLKGTVIGLWAISLLTPVLSAVLKPESVFVYQALFGFYSPVPRFWEFLTGAVLVFLSPRKVRPVFALGALFSATILMVIGFSLAAESATWPGITAVPIVFGTAALLLLGGQSPVQDGLHHKVFGSKILFWIGQRSYSIYLWHWPLLTFLFLVHPSNQLISDLGKIAAILVTVLLSDWSYKKFERRWKSSESKFVLVKGQSNTNKMRSFAVVMIVVLPIVVEPIFERLLVRQELAGDLRHRVAQAYVADKFEPCEGFLDFRCITTDKAHVDIFFLGDSTAWDLLPGAVNRFPETVITFREWRYASTGLEFDDSQSVTEELLASDSAPVFISLQWENASEYWEENPKAREWLVDSLRLLVSAGHEVVLVEGVPRAPFEPINCKFGIGFGPVFRSCEFTPEKSQAEKLYDDLHSNSGSPVIVNFVSLRNQICQDKLCSMRSGGNILYRDSIHLTLEGSILLASRAFPALGHLAITK